MAQAQEWRLGNKIHPTSKRISPWARAQEQFSGSTEIQVKVGEAFKAIRFHAADIKVTKAELVQGDRTPLQLASGKSP